ncbi:MAG: GDP-mannose 4,6-dehydratase [Pirellulales bacterium]
MSQRLFLVTGGAGFIGSNIVEMLVRRGDRVRVLDNLSTGNVANLSLCPRRDQVPRRRHDRRRDRCEGRRRGRRDLS